MGVQARLLDLNKQSVFVPCDNHSLNFVGVLAARVNVSGVISFGTVEGIYTFFGLKFSLRLPVLKNPASKKNLIYLCITLHTVSPRKSYQMERKCS